MTWIKLISSLYFFSLKLTQKIQQNKIADICNFHLFIRHMQIKDINFVYTV